MFVELGLIQTLLQLSPSSVKQRINFASMDVVNGEGENAYDKDQFSNAY